MKPLDTFIQHWRMLKIRPYLSSGARVLDIGCADGMLFKQFSSVVGAVVGIDPTLERSVEMERCKLIAGRFPDDLPDEGPFDAITMLAVLEHIPPQEQARWARACLPRLKPGGYLLVTVPSPIVDQILALLKFMKLIDGMSLEEHYGFEPKHVPQLFSTSGLKLIKARKFQCGCNNLFVFQKALTG